MNDDVHAKMKGKKSKKPAAKGGECPTCRHGYGPMEKMAHDHGMTGK